MLKEDIVKSLRNRYSNIHPLIFQRSIDRARDEVDLFDILDGFPNKYPVVWNDKERCWEITKDQFLEANFH